MPAGGLTGSDGTPPGAFTGSDGGVTGELTESGALGSSEAEGASTEPALTDGTAIDGVLREGTPVEVMVTGNEGFSTGALTRSEDAADGDTTLEGTPEGVLTIGAPLAGRLTGASTGRLFGGIPTAGVSVGIVTGRLNRVVTGKPERALVGRSVEGTPTGRLTGDPPTGVLTDDVGTSLTGSEEAGRLMSPGRKIMVSPTNG